MMSPIHSETNFARHSEMISPGCFLTLLANSGRTLGISKVGTGCQQRRRRSRQVREIFLLNMVGGVATREIMRLAVLPQRRNKRATSYGGTTSECARSGRARRLEASFSDLGQDQLVEVRSEMALRSRVFSTSNSFSHFTSSVLNQPNSYRQRQNSPRSCRADGRHPLCRPLRDQHIDLPQILTISSRLVSLLRQLGLQDAKRNTASRTTSTGLSSSSSFVRSNPHACSTPSRHVRRRLPGLLAPPASFCSKRDLVRGMGTLCTHLVPT